MIPKPNLRRNGELAVTGMEGGTGTAAKLTPDPRHTTHIPKPKVQGVRR